MAAVRLDRRAARAAAPGSPARGAAARAPEWSVDLGAPVTTGATVDALALTGGAAGAYEREFASGWAIVNPGDASVTLSFPAGAQREVVPSGGGAIDAAGDTPGTIGAVAATSLTLAAHSGAIVIK